MKVMVVSDIHFGVPESNINNSKVRRLFIDCIKSISPLDRVILLGDIFDLNLSRLGDALYGRAKRIIGFRQFLDELSRSGAYIKKWTYIPGNHDYDLFDIPSRTQGMRRRFNKKTEEKIIYWPPQKWDGWEIAPNTLNDKIEIQYPHRWENINGKYILVTHGHYFDHSQTLGHKIQKVNKKNGLPLDKFFTASAQYQGLARLVSYQRKSILVVGGLYRTGSVMKEFLKNIIKYGSVGLYRGKPLNQEMKKAAAAYISSFGALGRPRDASVVPGGLIFGHTHEEGMAFVDEDTARRYGVRRGFTLINDGGFVRDSLRTKIFGSFVVMESRESRCIIKIFVLEKHGSDDFKAVIAQECEI